MNRLHSECHEHWNDEKGNHVVKRVLRMMTMLAEQTVFGLAVFTGLNLVLNAASPRLGCNWIWINLADKPGSPGWFLLLFFVIGVLGWRWLKGGFRRPARIVAGIVGVVCLRDAAAYYWLLASGIITSAFPVPLSLLLGVLLVLWAAHRPEQDERKKEKRRPASLFLFSFFLFPFAIRGGAEARPVAAAAARGAGGVGGRAVPARTGADVRLDRLQPAGRRHRGLRRGRVSRRQPVARAL